MTIGYLVRSPNLGLQPSFAEGNVRLGVGRGFGGLPDLMFVYATRNATIPRRVQGSIHSNEWIRPVPSSAQGEAV
jgi:hypothetical protein